MSCVYWRAEVEDRGSSPSPPLLEPVVRRLLRDEHVVHVALAQPAPARRARSARRVAARRACAQPTVAHAGAQAADELLDDERRARPCTARGPRCPRAPASCRARRPPRPGCSGCGCPRARASPRASPCRDTACRCGPGTGSSRPGSPRCRRTGRRSSPCAAPAASALVMSPENLMPPSAITGTPARAAGRDRVGDGGELRHADAGDDARGADRRRAHADLDAVGAGLDQRARRPRRWRRCRRPGRSSGTALLIAAHRLDDRCASGRARCR